MNPDHLPLLRCPASGGPLRLESDHTVDGCIESGCLIGPTGNVYSIRGFIPRFVESEGYSTNFGLEWTTHARRQFDSDSGFSVSRDRFRNETRWPADLAGEFILEPGSGSGRFTEHALATGATVASFDYSIAVEQNYRSNGQNPRLLLVQADILRMPFAKASFDRAYCFGMLQHTPDPKASFMAIAEMLKPGGWVASDIYLKTIGSYYLNTRYWVRPITRRIEPQPLERMVRRYIDLMWPLARVLRRIPRLGEFLNWRLLIADYSPLLKGAPDETLKEWAYLDTFDMLSPRFDQPQTIADFRRWHEEAGLVDIDVHRGYNGIEGRARKRPST
jgi:SAM-dependent methyltransferase/uncharacterized protein YbaR (Trm112 family)